MGIGGSSEVPPSHARSLHELSAVDKEGRNLSLGRLCSGKVYLLKLCGANIEKRNAMHFSLPWPGT